MSTAHRRDTAGLLLLLTSTALVSGCSFSASVGAQIDKTVLAKTISDKLTPQIGTAPDKVDCPANLDAKKDASTRCTLDYRGKTYGVSVKVTSVDANNHAQFDIAVDKQPMK